MKLSVPLILAGWIMAVPGHAQLVKPPPPEDSDTPRGIDSRSGGGRTSGGVGVNPGGGSGQPKARYTTYLVLVDTRQWTSNDGTPLMGKLIAFEDLVVVAPKGDEPPESPEPPKHPTVVRQSKVRLLVDNKPFEVPLERLGERDRELIEKTRLAHAPKPAAGEE
jgi:hypothetical protein